MALRLAIIGCGAIAEHGHLPAVAALNEVEASLLVDTDLVRASALAKANGVAHVSTKIDDVATYADAAIIALPHHLHCPVAVELLSKGISVLVEKPMAVSVAECDQMIAAAQASGSTLAVGMMRRFSPGSLLLKRAIDLNLLGQVKSFEIEDGSVYSWNSATSFVLSKEHSGGGVLIGNGSHVFDSVVWWFGDPLEIDCETDAHGGMETDTTVELTMNNGVHGQVILSRSRNLKNQVTVHFERGILEIPTFGNTAVLRLPDSAISLRGDVEIKAAETDDLLVHAMKSQIADWVQSIASHSEPAISGKEARRSIALIQKCFEIAKPVYPPWLRPISLS